MRRRPGQGRPDRVDPDRLRHRGAGDHSGVDGDVQQPGQVNYTTLEFKAGHYALICFVPDAKDGQPHAMHGMVKEFTIQ